MTDEKRLQIIAMARRGEIASLLTIGSLAEDVRVLFAAYESEKARADAAERDAAELRKWMVDAADRWEDWASVPLESAHDANAMARTFSRELRTIVGATPVERCGQTGEPLDECGCFECDPEADAERRAECDADKSARARGAR